MIPGLLKGDSMRAVVSIVRYVVLKKSARQRIAKCEAEDLCLACMKPLEGIVRRHCHQRCYKATLRAVEKGLTTIEERVAEGKLGGDDKGGRPSQNPVTVELQG